MKAKGNNPTIRKRNILRIASNAMKAVPAKEVSNEGAVDCGHRLQ